MPSSLRALVPRNAKYVLSGSLVAVVLAFASVGLAPAAMSDSAAEEPSLEVPAPPSAEELPDKRTATSDTYELPSGRLETRIYGTPVNYKDTAGDWQPIEEGLEEGKDGEIVNGANSVEVSLPSELQEGPARVTIGDQWIGSRLLATETEPAEVSEGAAVYESPDAKTSFEYTTLPEGLKEEIELGGPSSPSSFRYELTASADLHAELAEDGSVVFRDQHGEVVAALPAPSVADAESVAPSSEPVSYQLAPREGGTWLLNVSVDPEWLNAPDRSFPVRIDPTVTAEKSDLDCTIGGKTGQEGWIDCASWGRETLLAGYNAEMNQAEDSWYRSLMYLQTANIPYGATVSAAALELYSPEAPQHTNGVAVHRVLKPWDWQANWRRYTLGHNWEAEGGDYTPEALGEESSQRHRGAGWWSIPIQAAKVQEKAQHEEDLSVIVKLWDDKSRSCGTSSCTHRLVTFASSNYYNGAYRPYFRVVYDFRKAIGAKMTSPEEGRQSSHYFTLRAGWDALGTAATGITYQMKLPGWNGYQIIPGQYVLDGNGDQVEWPYPVDGKSFASPPLYLDYPQAARALEPHVENPDEEDIKLRAVVSAPEWNAAATEPVTVSYAGEYSGVGATTDATAAVGPVNVDLLTGQYTLSRTDVSIPVPGSEANLEFARSYESNYRGDARRSTALGPGWEPSLPVEQEFEGQAWTGLIERHQEAETLYEEECFPGEGCERWPVEEIPAADWVELTDNEGGEAAFEKSGTSYVSPDYMKEFTLTKEGEGEGTKFALVSSAGVRTVFSRVGTSAEYRPATVSWQATSKSARMVYALETNPYRYKLLKEIGPAPSGVSCSDTTSTTTQGCRTLEFNYISCSCPNAQGTNRISSISYYGPSGSGIGVTVAQYRYDPEFRLVEESDPRLSPPLAETYSYETAANPKSWTLASITPPGQKPWQFGYYKWSEFSNPSWPEKKIPGRLKTVSRASLVEATPTATSTIVYRVPLTGSGSPYDLSPSAAATWGQSEYPVDATAIFPPDQVPTSPKPSDYSYATIHYLAPEGYEVNSASPAPPGSEGQSISTAEIDRHGNVIRELSPQSRLWALAAGSGSAAKARELDNHSVYNSEGTELLESWGPLHPVRLESGETKEARAHIVIRYEDETPPAGQAPYYLPTKETTGALQLNGTETDQSVTETHYNWNLRKPIETITDPGEGHLAIKSTTVYDGATGLPVEVRQPSNSGGGGAGTTKYVYYIGGKTSQKLFPECEENNIYAGRLCKTLPAGQASGTGRPELLVRTIKRYNDLDEPEEILESPGGGSSEIRKTNMSYDAAGRQMRKVITGGGVSIPKVETVYSEETGVPIAERFKCETECGAPRFLTSLGYASQSHPALKGPTDVAVDSSGNVWAVDKGNNRIVEYTEVGEFLREAGSLGSAGGQLKSPSAVAIDTWGNLDVADTGNNRVVRFSPEGKFQAVIGANVNKTKVEAGGTQAERNYCTASSGNLCQPGSTGSGEGLMAEPVGIASSTGGGGSVYVVERANNRVEKFGLQGELLAKFGSAGSASGQFKEPSSIAIGPKHLWVADTGNNRIEKWSFSWAYEGQFGTEGSGNGQLKAPAAVESDAAGNIWVAEQGNNRVQKFSEAGEYLAKFGSGGTSEGQFSLSSPTGLALDSKGNVLVADPGNNRVQKWSTTGFDTQETKTIYDSLGRPETYEDADGNVAKMTYDLDGRPVKTSDAKGSQTLRYAPTSGLPVELEDSAAGVFTASYNADGAMIKRGLPDGLTAETTYNPAGEPVHLSYTKASNCGASCLWLDFGLERSIDGQIRRENGTFGTDFYRYDKVGRLIYASETPQGGQCISHAYSYDADSNRLSKTSRPPGIGGICAESGGTTQNYEYDAADRLKEPTYDGWGRITSLPATYAGGQTLTTTYFANDMVASQSQGGISNSFQLDASLRQRQRLQGGGLEGAEVFHYDNPSDSSSWTVRGGTWTRNIPGLGGELAAIQESGKEITLQLTNLHGDVSAAAALNPEIASLKQTFSYDEFGNPTSGSTGRFGWLGGKQRQSELPSGVIQMGVRSYVPALGRFLTPDPIRGGSANSYDYANQDPVNNFDLNGEKCFGRTRAQVNRCIHEANQRTRRTAHSHGLKHLANYRRGARASGVTLPSTGGLAGALMEDIDGPASKAAVWTFKKLAYKAAEDFETRADMVKYAWQAAKSAGGWAWAHREQIVSCAKGASEMWAKTVALSPLPGGQFAVGFSMAVGCGSAFV